MRTRSDGRGLEFGLRTRSESVRGGAQAHAAAFVDEVVTVTDDEMRHAARRLFHAGIVAELSGAAALAAVLAGKAVPEREGDKVVVTVTGRNINFQEFTAVCGDGPLGGH